MNKRSLTLLMYGLMYGLPLISLLFGCFYPDGAAILSRGAVILSICAVLPYLLLRNRYMRRHDAASVRKFVGLIRLAMLGLTIFLSSLWVWLYPVVLSHETALMLATVAGLLKLQLVLPKWLNTTFDIEAQSAALETDDA